MYSGRPCYFTISPSSQQYTPTDATFCHSPLHTPDESASRPTTPLSLFPSSDPSLNIGVLAPSTTISFMQRQTSVAHQSAAKRPRPQPVQNVLHVTTDDSDSSSDNSYSSSNNSNSSYMDVARCSRCQRTASLASSNAGMIAYGLNLWYCTRCAGMVGLNR